jgi:hypothetical protein
MTLRLSCGDNIIAKWLKYNAIGQILSRFENLIPNPTQRKKKKKKRWFRGNNLVFMHQHEINLV